MNHLLSFDLIILFFILGAIASWAKSDLEMPEAISKFLSIFLLLSLGLKGGHEVMMADDLLGFLPALSLGLFSCLAIPFILFFLLKRNLGVANASALSASYGSVSAVTFITAQGILQNEGVNFSGYFVAIMALMEIPAILIAVFLYKKYSNNGLVAAGPILRSILSTKSFLLLIGGFIIGLLMNETSWNGIAPVIKDCFKGALAFFLLDLGIVAQKQLREARSAYKIALPIAILAPLTFGVLALFVSSLLGLERGDRVLLAVLVGSASYIAAPATMRASVPEANPSLYLALPLAITFPMNLLIGIPIYIELSRWF